MTGRWSDHGRDDVVLIAAEDYTRLSRYQQQAFHVTQLPKDVVDELGTVPVPEAASKFDDEYQP